VKPPYSRLLLALLFLPLCTGCAVLQKILPKRKPIPKAERAHPEPERVGVIMLVNEDAHFVLIDTTNGTIPTAGTALKVLRRDAEISVLQCGGIQRRPFVVADIVSGTPAKGDVVMQ